jgi:uncharacterized protein (DUF2236 family)
VRRFLSGQERPPAQRFRRRPGDQGLFGPGSVTWQVHADLSMVVGGLRALLVQTLHPLAMAGVAGHSDYRADPWGRLHRTGQFLAETTFGSRDQAEAALARVRRVHEKVRGVAVDGRPYSAQDPELLLWVHATEVHSFLVAYERYGRAALGPGAADRYVAEMAELGERMGATGVPRSRAELRSYFHDVRPELSGTEEAREAVRFLLWPPVSPAVRPAYLVVNGAAVGLLPGFARRELLLALPPAVEPLVVRPATTVLLRLLGWTLAPPLE